MVIVATSVIPLYFVMLILWAHSGSSWPHADGFVCLFVCGIERVRQLLKIMETTFGK